MLTRDEFMEFVYNELATDSDNFRANRIIDAADEHAEWIEYDRQKIGCWFDIGVSCRCSNCGCKNNKTTNYCPSCGAFMKG